MNTIPEPTYKTEGEWLEFKKELIGLPNILSIERKLLSFLSDVEVIFLKSEANLFDKYSKEFMDLKNENKRRKKVSPRRAKAVIVAEDRWKTHCRRWLNFNNPAIRILLERKLTVTSVLSVELSIKAILDLPAEVGHWWPTYLNTFVYINFREASKILEIPEIMEKVTAEFIDQLWLVSSFANSKIARELTTRFADDKTNKLKERLKVTSTAILFSKQEHPGTELIFEDARGKLIVEARKKYGLRDIPDSWVEEIASDY